MEQAIAEIKNAIRNGISDNLTQKIKGLILTTENFAQLASIQTLLRAAQNKNLINPPAVSLKVAILSGYSTELLSDLIQTCAFAADIKIEFHSVPFGSLNSQVLNSESSLYAFAPDLIVLIPSEFEFLPYTDLYADYESQARKIDNSVLQVSELAQALRRNSNSEIIVSNFRLNPDQDFTYLRSRNLGTPWAKRKYFNAKLGQALPEDVFILDSEFISAKIGTANAHDERLWLQSRQMGSATYIFEIAKEIVHLISHTKKAQKKVLALDLDNTLWGGVIGDDGLEGIELGDVSPRAEAFKNFQKYIRTLASRGVLLGVCSKNNEEVVFEAFRNHPEMVLRHEDIVSFKVNWKSKADNLAEMAQQLNLGLDSFVFVDDNPAEIAVVNQFLPEVSTILLPEDPASFVRVLQDSRYFDTKQLTAEDAQRTRQYKAEESRQGLLKSVTDYSAYLKSLEMKMSISVDDLAQIGRITQLINKSNQWNVTTIRRTEAEIKSLMESEQFSVISARVSDRFGDHGLISVLILKHEGSTADIDTWVMSCRVLERQIEHEIFNQTLALARKHGCEALNATYVPTKKNILVKDLFPKLGLKAFREEGERKAYTVKLSEHVPHRTFIEQMSSL